MIALPWGPKLLYGIITDTFPICQSRKKSYLVLCGFLQASAALILAVVPFKRYEYAVLFGLILYLSQAFMDVVVDGLMVMESRKDPKQGSVDLQTFSWAMFGVGGTLFGILGGFLLEHTSAKVIFFVTAVLGLILGISGFALDSNLEHCSNEIIQMSLWARIKLNSSQIKEGFTIQELRNTITFMFLFASVVPNFGDYMYYFYMDELNFSKLEYSLLSVIGNVLLLLVVLGYNFFFA